MSETRPPMTAGPIARALRFLKSTSVNCGAPEVGAGVTEADNAGLVLSGDAAGRAPAAAGEEPGGDSSWAKEIEVSSRPDTTASRVIINWRGNHGDLPSHSKQIAVVARRQSRVLSILYDAASAGRKGWSCFWCGQQTQYRMGDCPGVGECWRALDFQLSRRTCEGKR